MSMHRRCELLLLCMVGVVAASGCTLFGNRSPRIDTSGNYDGPAVSIDSSGGTHIVVFQAPTAGWSARFDRAERRFAQTRVFITLTQPPAGSMVAQVVTPLAVDTGVAVDQRIAVYVRQRVFGQQTGSAPYHRALEQQADVWETIEAEPGPRNKTQAKPD